MTDRPILCVPSVARAIWEGRQTQDRRPLKEQPAQGIEAVPVTRHPIRHASFRAHEWRARHSTEYYGDVQTPFSVGDRLWVREYFSVAEHPVGSGRGGVRYWADGGWSAAEPTPEWRKQFSYRGGQMTEDGYGPIIPSIHAPRWASRQTLLVTGVRVQRLQDISDEDCFAEGLEKLSSGLTQAGEKYRLTHPWACNEGWGSNDENSYSQHGWDFPKMVFADLWNSLYGSRPGLSWDDNPWVAATTFQVVRKNIDRMEE